MHPRIVTRKKTLVIPYITQPDGNHLLLLVRDTRSAEYAFVTGGCKQIENPLDCAQRELAEETNGIFRLNYKNTMMHMTSFETWFRPEEHKKQDKHQNLMVKTIYQMVLFPIAETMKRYHMRAISGNKEVSQLRFFTFHELFLRFIKLDKLSSPVPFWEDMMQSVPLCLPSNVEYPSHQVNCLYLQPLTFQMGVCALIKM